MVSRGERPELTSDIGARRVVHDFPEAGVAKRGEFMPDTGGGADLYHARRPRSAPDVLGPRRAIRSEKILLFLGGQALSPIYPPESRQSREKSRLGSTRSAWSL